MESAELRDRLSPPTLDQTKSQVDAAAEQRLDAPGEATSKDEEVYSFPFRYETARGKVYEGRVTTKILTVDERIRVGQTLALQRMGAPWASFDPLTQDLQRARVHMSYSLTEYPDWAKPAELVKLLDYGVVQALYTEVFSHERWFLLREVYPESSSA